MGQLELMIALVGFVGTNAVVIAGIVGAVLYLRADARANRQEWKAESEANRQEWKAESEANRQEWKAELAEFKTSVTDAINQLSQRVGALEIRVAALESRVEASEEKLSSQAERNHRELLIRLAFHHHGDGRYPVAPATDPDPVDSSDSD